MSGLTAVQRANQRIPFGKNGIKDGNGNVIRTDHATMSDVVNDFVDGTGVSRQDIMNMKVEQAVSGGKKAIELFKKSQ